MMSLICYRNDHELPQVATLLGGIYMMLLNIESGPEGHSVYLLADHSSISLSYII